MRTHGRPAHAAAAALRAVDRRGFLPRDQVAYAHFDGPLPIGYGATNSQPFTVEYMLRLLDVRRGMRVLDVGSGSGWTTALLAHLCGPTGSVIGVEIVPELVEMGRGNLRRASARGEGARAGASALPGSREDSPAPSNNARIELAQPGVLGYPDGAPFHRILVSADGGRIPAELVAQLATGGRMVLPADGDMLVVSRSRAGVGVHRAPGGFRFVPLR